MQRYHISIVLVVTILDMNKKQKRQPKLFDCRLVSERGDSNARPLRPERSALPTALHSAIINDEFHHLLQM